MTSFDDIEDIALVLVDDYKLAKLSGQSTSGFQTYCDGFLIASIPKFWQCNQSLDNDTTTRQFTATLSSMEINILAKLWVIAWWERETNNAAQIAQKLKTPSAFQFDGVSSQNFKEKQNIIDKLNEDVNRDITSYSLLSLDSYSY